MTKETIKPVAKEIKATPVRKSKRAPRDERKRLLRSPLSPTQLVNIPKDPNYVYRIVHINNQREPERMLRYERLGYEVVDTSGIEIAEQSHRSHALGSEVNLGHNDRAVVMRIPKEWYDENQLDKPHVDPSKPLKDGNGQVITQQKKYDALKNAETLKLDGGTINADSPLHIEQSD